MGGLLIGWGMAIAQSCVSGLLYKFGAGMLGGAVGIAGRPHPGCGRRRAVAVGWARTAPAAWCERCGTAVGILGYGPAPHWQWNWPTLGLALGAVLGWVLAAVAGVDFGPSTVGASAGVAAGDPNWWLIAFLLGIILGVRAMTRSGRRDPATTLPLNDR